MSKLKTGLIIGSFVAFTAAAMVPVFVYPRLHPEVYQEIQKKTREGIKQEEIQPGGMKVWSDPFDRKKP